MLSKKSWLICMVYSLYKKSQNFFDIQYYKDHLLLLVSFTFNSMIVCREIIFLREFGNHPNIIRLLNVHRASNDKVPTILVKYIDLKKPFYVDWFIDDILPAKCISYSTLWTSLLLLFFDMFFHLAMKKKIFWTTIKLKHEILMTSVFVQMCFLLADSLLRFFL